MSDDEILNRKQTLLIYQQGAGGHLIQRILHRIRDNKLISNIVVSEAGDCHHYEPYGNYDTIELNHFSTSDNINNFDYRGAVLSDYKMHKKTDTIIKMHPGDSPYLIDHLHEFLPNTEFAVIQTSSYVEDLACILMKIKKWDLSTSKWPVTKNELLAFAPDDNIIRTSALLNTLEDITFEFECYLTWMVFLRSRYPTVRFDDILDTPSSKVNFLQFDDIFNNNSQRISDFCSAVLHREVTNVERRFIASQLNEYLLKQNKLLLADPVGYLRTVEQVSKEFANDSSKNHFRNKSITPPVLDTPDSVQATAQTNTDRLLEPHIAVIYHPGTGGHFVGTLIKQLYYGTRTVNISSGGDCHVNSTPGVPQFIFPVNTKLSTVNDSYLTRQFLHSSVTLLKFPGKNYVYVNHPCSDQIDYINRFHDILPNTQFVSIDQDGGYTGELRRLIMHNEKRTFHKDTPKEKTVGELQYTRLSDELFHKTLNSYDPDNQNTTAIRYMIWTILQSTSLQREDIENAELVESDRVHRFSMNAVFTNDHVKVIKSLEKILSRKLSEDESDFVRSSLTQYCSSQNQVLLHSPVTWALTLREDALKFINEAKATALPNISFVHAQQGAISDLILHIISNIQTCKPVNLSELTLWQTRAARLNLSPSKFNSESEFMSHITSLVSTIRQSDVHVLINSSDFGSLGYCDLVFPESRSLVIYPSLMIDSIINTVLEVQSYTPQHEAIDYDVISQFDQSDVNGQDAILKELGCSRINDATNIPNLQLSELLNAESDAPARVTDSSHIYIDPGWVRTKDFNHIVRAIGEITNINLSEAQIEFIIDSLTLFRASLDEELLIDPVDYFNNWCYSNHIVARKLINNDLGSFTVNELHNNSHIGVLFNMGSCGDIIQHLLACAESGILIDIDSSSTIQNPLPQVSQFNTFIDDSLLRHDMTCHEIAGMLCAGFNNVIVEKQFVPHIYGFHPNHQANLLIKLISDILPKSKVLAITVPTYIDALRCGLIFTREHFLNITYSSDNLRGTKGYNEFAQLADMLQGNELAMRLIQNRHIAPSCEIEDYLYWKLFDITVGWHVNDSQQTITPGVSASSDRIVELPVSAIINNHQLVIDTFEKVLDRKLSQTTQNFIEHNLEKVVNRICTEIINDPVSYVRYLEQNAAKVEATYL